MGDLHCGHVVGLTPPSWQRNMVRSDPRWSKYSKLSADLWKFYEQGVRAVQKEKPIDIMFVLGDCIDGAGSRSGGTELITTDRKVQAKIATECLSLVGAPKTYMVYGTPYHTGDAEDFEEIVANNLGASIKSQCWVDVNGCVFDLKHFVGSSQVPYGRGASVGRDQLWNLIFNERGEQPKADVLLRGHVHYYEGRFNSRYLGMTLPALQGFGSKFGARKMSGVVDFGFVVFDIDEKGAYSWYPVRAEIKGHQAKVIKV